MLNIRFRAKSCSAIASALAICRKKPTTPEGCVRILSSSGHFVGQFLSAGNGLQSSLKIVRNASFQISPCMAEASFCEKIPSDAEP
jgi:hypothetical protein